MTPSLVLFDLDGVLVEYDRSARLRHLGDALGHSAGRVREALFDSGLETRFDAGLIDTADYLQALGAALDATIDRPLWTAARAAAMRVPDTALEGLDIVSRRCEVAILTNNGPLLGEVLPQAAPALFPRFMGRVLCSGVLGGLKPDPRVYVEALRRLGHAPSRTLFLDDVVANVEGARQAGLHAEHVAVPGDFTAQLTAYGLA